MLQIDGGFVQIESSLHSLPIFYLTVKFLAMNKIGCTFADDIFKFTSITILQGLRVVYFWKSFC
uniref:Uncharacterized protein n=1 Tax=Rhizophora mucronata TaxID=61149 RepID=A0A2P2QTC8_RHIMU